MISLTYLATISCLVLTVIATDDELQIKTNDYVDDFIDKATKGSGGFIDPLPLEDLNRTFEREIGFMKVKGEAKIYDSKIMGLSSLKRKGNAVVLDLDDLLLISTQLNFQKVHATYKGALLLNDIGPRVTLDARIGDAKVTMTILVPAEGGKANLMSCDIKFKNVRVSIYGLGPMGWAAGMMSSLVLNSLEKPVAKFASARMFEYFSKEIEKCPFPGTGNTTTTVEF